jgi:hypothetical protein
MPEMRGVRDGAAPRWRTVRPEKGPTSCPKSRLESIWFNAARGRIPEDLHIRQSTQPVIRTSACNATFVTPRLIAWNLVVHALDVEISCGATYQLPSESMRLVDASDILDDLLGALNCAA